MEEGQILNHLKRGRARGSREMGAKIGFYSELSVIN